MRKPQSADAFYWREPGTRRFHVIVLHDTRRWRGKRYCREFSAPTVRELREKVATAGYRLGRNVRGLCEGSRRWTYGY